MIWGLLYKTHKPSRILSHFCYEEMSTMNTVTAPFSNTALTEAIISQGLPKNCDAVPHWKYFQISAAGKPPGFKKRIFLIYTKVSSSSRMWAAGIGLISQVLLLIGCDLFN